MNDISIQPKNTLVFGMTGSGKTTFINCLLLNSNPAAFFLFDNLNRMAPRVRRKMLYTAYELEAALATRWVCFNPAKMFPGDTKSALRWFCFWVYHVCERGPGEKMVCLPEVWQHCSQDSIPVEFAMLAQAGRELGVHLIMDTQQPEKLNDSIVNASTEIVCFRLQEGSEAVRCVRKYGFDPVEIQRLPMGSFVAKNRMNGVTRRGMIFYLKPGTMEAVMCHKWRDAD